MNISYSPTPKQEAAILKRAQAANKTSEELLSEKVAQIAQGWSESDFSELARQLTDSVKNLSQDKLDEIILYIQNIS